MTDRRRLFWVLLFAVAMAWLEAAVVLYLRTLVGRVQPYQQNPLQEFGPLGIVEMLREAATLAMLFAVGRLAGHNSHSRWAFSLVAFGIWDIFYYLFLIPLTGWPKSLLDWDILFLLPVPWWGPVLAPVSVSLLLVAGGLLVVLSDLWPGKPATIAGGAGIVLVLYAFMENSIRAPRTLPGRFSWRFSSFQQRHLLSTCPRKVNVMVGDLSADPVQDGVDKATRVTTLTQFRRSP